LKISNETKVGILATTAITVLILGYSFLKGMDLFSTDDEFYAVYDEINGLTVSKPVYVNGFQVGRVSQLSLTPEGKIIAEFQIDPDYRIPKNTKAQLENTDLLGGKAVIFYLGDSPEYAADGDTIAGTNQSGLMDQLKPVQEKANLIAGRMDSVLNTINQTLNPEFQRNFNQSFNSIAQTLKTLESTSRKVDGLVGSESKRIGDIMKNLESMSANLKKISAEGVEARLGETLVNANKAVSDLQLVINKINTGQGSLGLLVNDQALYKNLNQAAANLDQLMVDLKAHPKRYVHFSIFGKKSNTN
jgi:phospholipid/cholesterol/gamma-HCH transport system substrate-binding protein